MVRTLAAQAEAIWPQEELRTLFNQVIDDIRDPTQYAVWHIPVVSGRKA